MRQLFVGQPPRIWQTHLRQPSAAESGGSGSTGRSLLHDRPSKARKRKDAKTCRKQGQASRGANEEQLAAHGGLCRGPNRLNPRRRIRRREERQRHPLRPRSLAVQHHTVNRRLEMPSRPPLNHPASVDDERVRGTFRQGDLSTNDIVDMMRSMILRRMQPSDSNIVAAHGDPVACAF